MSAPIWAGVAFLGGLGALGRFRLDTAVARRMPGGFPWGTLAVNILAAFLAGVVFGVRISGGAEILLAVGALGSFSTFSTWMLEAHRSSEEGSSALAAANVLAGVLGGLAAALAGWGLGSLL